ncbi:STM3941 family protein [Chryseobacterium sp. Y16C]|uniref:STM3941 family protein n=1 Tax=Chryseobacterium sp. Y16C TaxID=2920939 RepID=UPI00293EA06D|nr:STM3941 family protein [Chryseobacterium sp. Y16C]
MHKLQQRELFLIIVVMSLILILGIFFIMSPIKYTSFVYRNGLIIFIVGIISIILSLFCIYEFCRKLFNKKAMFSINNKGIWDGVNILDYPFINWENVIRIEECNVNNVPHLKVLVNNPEQYINQKKGLKKWVLNFNFKKYQTPILLNKTYLSGSFDEFRKIILDSYNEYK